MKRASKQVAGKSVHREFDRQAPSPATLHTKKHSRGRNPAAKHEIVNTRGREATGAVKADAGSLAAGTTALAVCRDLSSDNNREMRLDQFVCVQ